MNNILVHVSCSTNGCFVVLSNGVDLIDFTKIDQMKLSEEFISRFDLLLKKNNIEVNNIKEIYLDTGPGNNIGIRISILSIYPFAALNNIAIKTFSILDFNENTSEKIFIFKSGKNSVIYIKYDAKTYKTNLESLDKMLERINPKSNEIIANFEIKLNNFNVQKIEISPENIIKISLKSSILQNPKDQIQPTILIDEIL